jgi:DNA polymerase V
LSANFALYGDLSDRMMSLAAGLGPRQEIYSIDESFIDLTGVRGDLVKRSQVLCFIRTSPFRAEAQFSRSICVPLRRPSADTAVILGAALAGLRAIYQPGFQLAKAGVMLLDLQSDAVVQAELPLEDDDTSTRQGLMTALDELNLRYGRGTVLMGSAGLAGNRRLWSMKQEHRSPGYTTCWGDLPVAKA